MSPRGFQGVRQTSAEIEARRGSGGPGALWFRIKSGEEAIVRFLEQDEDIAWCMMHEVPVEGRQFGRDVVCCDQEKEGNPCPGCEQQLPRKFKGFVNLIWFSAPVFKRDAEGKLVKDRTGDLIIVELKPQVAVWGSGIRLFEELDEVNANFRGLTSRPFRVKRKGEKLSTKYSIAPADTDAGAVPMNAAEKELAKSRYDLNLFIKVPTYDEFLKELGQAPVSSNGPSASAPRTNPFMRRESN